MTRSSAKLTSDSEKPLGWPFAPKSLWVSKLLKHQAVDFTVRQKMTSLVTDELRSALATLGISDEQFEIMPDHEGRAIFDVLLHAFTGGVDCRWWWEKLSHDSYSVKFEDGKAFTRICSVVPDPYQRVYFVVEDDSVAFFPVCLTTPLIAQKVIGECYGFEYYLIPKDRSWLLCENHHNSMFGVGDRIIASLKRLEAEQGFTPNN